MAQWGEGGPSADGAVRRAHGEAAPWIERLARAGYAAKGIVYVLVGILAVSAAIGSGRATTGSAGAMASIADAAWGRALLGLIAVGLVGYVVWRFVSAALNPEDDGAGRRVFYLVTGILYAGLAFQAVLMALHGPDGGGASAAAGNGSGGGDKASNWTATLMSQPFGRWLVGLAGLAVVAYGLQQIYKAYTAEVDERLSLSALSASARTWTVRTARFGLGARGVVFCMVGAFLVVSAAQAQPDEARGIGGALKTLEQQPYGPWLLLAVAVGLIAYGVYNVVRARYRRIQAA